jgi:hypothetical protein
VSDDIKPHGIPGLQFRFFNQEAHDWYDPLKPYTLLEYEWVRANCKLDGETVIDAGCHHGNYSVVFKPAFVIAVDNVMSNCNFAKSNMALNDVDGVAVFQTLGADGIKTNKRPGIYKVDIEGSEFQLLPKEIDRFPSVHTWIVEIHPHQGDPNRIARDFAGRGFDLLKVDREEMTVREYIIGEYWQTHATLIARKAIK